MCSLDALLAAVCLGLLACAPGEGLPDDLPGERMRGMNPVIGVATGVVFGSPFTHNLFFWLNATEWTAVATVVLCIVTFVYVLITRNMARTASESARQSADAAKDAKSAAEALAGANELQAQANKHLERAAASARDAARAAQEATQLQLAQLPVDFMITYSVVRIDSVGAYGDLTVTCTASRVYFQGLLVLVADGTKLEPPFFEPEPTPQEMALSESFARTGALCRPAPHSPIKLPYLMHRGEAADMLFPAHPLDPKKKLVIDLVVLYSLEENGTPQWLYRSATKINSDEINLSQLWTRLQGARSA